MEQWTNFKQGNGIVRFGFRQIALVSTENAVEEAYGVVTVQVQGKKVYSW